MFTLHKKMKLSARTNTSVWLALIGVTDAQCPDLLQCFQASRSPFVPPCGLLLPFGTLKQCLLCRLSATQQDMEPRHQELPRNM